MADPRGLPNLGDFDFWIAKFFPPLDFFLSFGVIILLEVKELALELLLVLLWFVLLDFEMSDFLSFSLSPAFL